MSRISNVIKNIKYSIIYYFIYIIITFITRLIFIKTLGLEYLGINGLFSNVLSLLSITELGIGTAIVYSMYKPLAEKNESEIRALTDLYRKAYYVIGIFILLLSLSIIPFLDFFIKDIPKISGLIFIYIMFIINSTTSYFFAHKRSLIIADQKNWIITKYHYSFGIILNLIQIPILLITNNYILFLSLQIINTLFENIYISRIADKMYPFIKDKEKGKIKDHQKEEIVKNIRALVFHKIGSFAVKGTDNIILSKYIGITTVGIYSNYLLIIQAVDSIFGFLFNSIISSVGNLGAIESKSKSSSIFKSLHLLNFWIYSFVAILFINLLNPLISLWLGKDYLFSSIIVFVLSINFYLSGMRKSFLIFKDAFGLFWYDRYKPLLEAAVNLIVSIFLAKTMGTIGVFLGTTICILTTVYWIEPYVVSKYGFNESPLKYFKSNIYYLFIFIIVGYITYTLCNLVTGHSIFGFIIKIIITLIIPNLIFLLLFNKKDEFKYLYNVLKKQALNLRD